MVGWLVKGYAKVSTKVGWLVGGYVKVLRLVGGWLKVGCY